MAVKISQGRSGRGRYLLAQTLQLQNKTRVRFATDLGVSDGDTYADHRESSHHPKGNPAFLPSLLLRDNRGQRRFSFEFFPLGVEHLKAQAIIRCLFTQLCPHSGEELNPLKGNAQHIIRTQIESTAAL